MTALAPWLIVVLLCGNLGIVTAALWAMHSLLDELRQLHHEIRVAASATAGHNSPLR